MQIKRLAALSLAAIVTAAMLTGCWDGAGQDASASSSSGSSSTSSRPDTGGDDGGSESSSSSEPEQPEDPGFTYDEATNTYMVRTQAGFDAWAEAVAGDLSVSCTLQTDVDASGWSSKGDFSNHYTGTLDGNGHTISGLSQRLFHSIGETGRVLDLTIEGNITDNESDGAIASRNYGTIMGCTVKANVTYYNGGGIVWENRKDGKIVGCLVTGNISVGQACTGGGVAQANLGDIVGCAVTGEVGNNDGDSGGIVRVNSGSYMDGGQPATAEGTIRACYWSCSPENAVADSSFSGKVEESCARVTDGNWSDAINTMNQALTEEGCPYRFKQGANGPEIVLADSLANILQMLL